MPLIVYIQGSGNASLFAKSNNEQIALKSGHITWANPTMKNARVLIVEIPGVQYLQQDENNPAFDARFTVDSWAKRIEQIIRTILKMEKIDSPHILIAGHSEGGIAAAKVTNNKGRVVSHTQPFLPMKGLRNCTVYISLPIKEFSLMLKIQLFEKIFLIMNKAQQ